MQHDLTIDALYEGLTTRWLGRRAIYLPRVGSTNQWLNEQLATNNAPSQWPTGLMVYTDYQERGKGRLGRSWLAPAGTSLLISALFWPDWPSERAGWLAMMAGVAAAEAVEAVTGLDIRLKWPNDLVIGREETGWRKLAGLLLEGHFEKDRFARAIVGMGLNVNIAATDLPAAATPATSLLVETGQPVSRLALLLEFLRCLEIRYEAASLGDSPHEVWNQRLITIGQAVRVSHGGEQTAVLTGTATGTDAQGRLLVQDSDGTVYTIDAADVTLRQ